MADDRDLKAHQTIASTEAELSPKLTELLVCPLTKQPLVYDGKRKEMISKAARLAYPVRGGIPIMLPSEARSLDESEL